MVCLNEGHLLSAPSCWFAVLVEVITCVCGWMMFVRLQEVSLSPILSHDPLPPLDSVAAYTRPPRYRIMAFDYFVVLTSRVTYPIVAILLLFTCLQQYTDIRIKNQPVACSKYEAFVKGAFSLSFSGCLKYVASLSERFDSVHWHFLTLSNLWCCQHVRHFLYFCTV